MREAMFYRTIEDRFICELCPNRCMIKPGDHGICRTRSVENGRLYARNYGQLAAIAIDPIEKKPLANWFPGTEIYSIGSFGCNLHCPFCQNHEISMEEPSVMQLSPEAVVAQCEAYDLPAIAYTYNEPTVFYEMVYDTARLAHEKGIKNVLVTNGYINEEPLKKLLPYIDAMNIDIKTYSEKRMLGMLGGRLDQVLRTLEIAREQCHVEITMLIVPGLNDDADGIEGLGGHIRRTYGDFPIHISRYFPRYHFDEPATDMILMQDIQRRLKQYFTHVYLGNVGA